ncbi:armadillo-like helical protein [Babesia gibsoni]|uniref:Armadillo-like helical protein n=1 Tax=Babesia gibsoni TaxID=33632 RepID=A0AAD8UTQ0_BABGI|nr:armadillo-like helical protein [Babesia gibsoni]
MATDQLLNSEALRRALEGSISQDQQLRRHSEDYLFRITTTKGSIPLLLSLITTELVDPAVRLAGAIKLKNLVLTQWREENAICEEDKNTLWARIYVTIISVGPGSETIRRQFYETLRHIVFNAEDNRISHLVQRVKIDIEQRSNGDTLLCALKVLRKLLYRYEYHPKSLTDEVNSLVDGFFEQLLKIAQDASKAGLESPEAATCIHQVLKLYFSMCLLTSPTTATMENTLQSWMALTKFVLDNPVPWNKLFVPGEHAMIPYAELPDHEESRINQLPQFKCFKWALQVLTRYMSRQVVRKADKDESKRHITKFLKDGYAAEFAKKLIVLMQNEMTGGVVLTNSLHYRIWTYLKYAIPFPAVYNAAIKPFSQVIVQMLFQTFAFSLSDEQEYLDDPESYIQNCADVSFQLLSPRGTASDFIKDVCKQRAADFVPIVITAAKGVFESQNKTSQNLYGVMCLVGHASSSVLQHSKKSKKAGTNAAAIPDAQLLDGEAFVEAYVIPMLLSGDKWLRMRSAWLCGRVMLTVTTWRNNDSLLNLYSRLVEMINDEEIMVSVMATGAVLGFFHSQNEALQKTIVDFLPHLLQSLFKLMERIELESVVATLDEIVKKYSVAALPFGAQITENVCNALWNSISSDISQGMVSDDSNNDEQVLARWSMLQTLTSIVKLAADMDPKDMKQSDCDMFVKITQNTVGLLSLLYEKLDQDRLMDYLDDLALILGYLAKIVHKVVVFTGEENAAAMGARFSDLWRVLALSMKAISVYHELDKESEGDISPVMVELSVLRDPVRSLLAHAPSGFTYEIALQLYTLCQQACNSEDYQHAERLLADMFEVCINNRACDPIFKAAASELSNNIKKCYDAIVENPQFYKSKVRYAAVVLIYSCGEKPPLTSIPEPDALISIIMQVCHSPTTKYMEKLMFMCLTSLLQVGVVQCGYESLYGAIDSMLVSEAQDLEGRDMVDSCSDGYENASVDYDYDSDYDSDDDYDYDSDYDDSYEDDYLDDGCSPLDAVAYNQMRARFLNT